jgi:Domain of unknown function (DUF4845)
MKSVQQLKLAGRQRGMSTLSLLVVVALIGLGITCGLKMIPAYLDYWTLKGIFESVEAEPTIKQELPAQVHSTLQKKLDINNIRDFNLKETTTVVKEEGQLTIEFYYEVRQALFANVDVVMKFEHHFHTAAGE